MISRITLLTMITMGCLTVVGQSPVQWKYSTTRIDASTYEVHLTAVIRDGWHIYAQEQPAEAIAMPTKISFKANPLVSRVGKVMEVGKKEIQSIKELDIQQFEYADSVDFIQKITLKAAVKTTCSGTVTFQACTDKQCLPPKEEAFNVLL